MRRVPSRPAPLLTGAARVLDIDGFMRAERIRLVMDRVHDPDAMQTYWASVGDHFRSAMERLETEDSTGNQTDDASVS